MNVTKKQLEPTKISLTISANADDIKPLKEHALEHLAHKVKVSGFRDGKAPLEIIEKNVDQTVLIEEFTDEALNTLYVRALDQEDIRPVSNPDVTIKKFVPFTELEFEVLIDVIGDVKFPDYKKMKVAKKPVSITTKDVDEVIESLRKRLATREESKDAIKNGDEAVIYFKGTDDKAEAVAGAEGDDYPLGIGSNTFIPGFEDNLIGLKAGDNKEFTIKFPEDYGLAALQGRNVTFKVDIKKVNKIVLPAVDDKFASEAGPFKTVDELKEDIKKELKEERERQADRDYENELIAKITEASTAEIPSVLVDNQVLRFEEEEKQNLLYRGQSWEEHLKFEGLTEQEHRDKKRPEAEATVKTGVVLSRIADAEDIQVTPEDLEIRLKLLKGQYQDPKMQAELERPESIREITNQLAIEKTVAKLIEYSTKN